MPETIRDIVRNTFNEKLAQDRVVSKLSVRVFGGIEIVHIAKSCGFDALYIDLQHNALSLETVSRQCIAALGAGITPIVRVPGCRKEYVSRILDGGAMGVTIPEVHSCAEVEEAVRYSKFPPIGERSTGGGLPQLQYRNWPQAEAFEAMNAATTLLVNIETVAALDGIEEIAAVKGLDVLMIGTNDLCAELGIPGQHGHDLIRKAYARIIAAGRRHGKHVGVGGISDRKLVAEYVALGARVVSCGSDLSAMMTAGSERVQFVRGLIT